MRDVRNNRSPLSRSLETPLAKMLAGMIEAAAKRLHPAVLQEMVRDVGAQLVGRRLPSTGWRIT